MNVCWTLQNTGTSAPLMLCSRTPFFFLGAVTKNVGGRGKTHLVEYSHQTLMFLHLFVRLLVRSLSICIF